MTKRDGHGPPKASPDERAETGSRSERNYLILDEQGRRVLLSAYDARDRDQQSAALKEHERRKPLAEELGFGCETTLGRRADDELRAIRKQYRKLNRERKQRNNSS